PRRRRDAVAIRNIASQAEPHALSAHCSLQHGGVRGDPMDLRLTDDRLADDESSGRIAIFWTYALGIAAGALMAVII
ncbi:MAG TPA: hypothetical protein VGD36_09625, partial [Xanthobacteraceae bacterium]